MSAPVRLSPLDAATRAAVAAHYDATDHPEERTRAQMILLANDHGLTAPQIALVVHCSSDTVLRVLRAFEATGLAGIPYQYRPGGHRLVTADWLAELARVIALDPRTVGVESANWTTGLLAEYLAQATGIAVADETVRDYLHRLGYVCKRPTWTLAEKARAQEGWVGNAYGWRSC